MANGYEPPSAGDIVESPKARKTIYKAAGYTGLVLTAGTVGLAAFGITPELYPWLLAAWSVHGVFNKWATFVADKNVH